MKVTNDRMVLRRAPNPVRRDPAYRRHSAPAPPAATHYDAFERQRYAAPGDRRRRVTDGGRGVPNSPPDALTINVNTVVILRIDAESHARPIRIDGHSRHIEWCGCDGCKPAGNECVEPELRHQTADAAPPDAEVAPRCFVRQHPLPLASPRLTDARSLADTVPVSVSHGQG